MIRELIDWIAGLYADLSGCDPEAPADEPCIVKARKKAATTVLIHVLIIVIILFLAAKKFVNPILSSG